METPYINSQEKERHIQELFNASVKKCTRAAKRDCIVALPIITIVAVFLLFFPFYTNEPIQGLKIASIIILTLALAAYCIITIRANSQIGKAQDVNELLRIHDHFNTKMRTPVIAILLVGMVTWITIHYTGKLDTAFLINVIFITLLTSWCIYLLIKRGVTDCKEIREIKELMDGKN